MSFSSPGISNLNLERDVRVWNFVLFFFVPFRICGNFVRLISSLLSNLENHKVWSVVRDFKCFGNFVVSSIGTEFRLHLKIDLYDVSALIIFVLFAVFRVLCLPWDFLGDGKFCILDAGTKIFRTRSRCCVELEFVFLFLVAC